MSSTWKRGGGSWRNRIQVSEQGETVSHSKEPSQRQSSRSNYENRSYNNHQSRIHTGGPNDHSSKYHQNQEDSSSTLEHSANRSSPEILHEEFQPPGSRRSNYNGKASPQRLMKEKTPVDEFLTLGERAEERAEREELLQEQMGLSEQKFIPHYQQQQSDGDAVQNSGRATGFEKGHFSRGSGRQQVQQDRRFQNQQLESKGRYFGSFDQKSSFPHSSMNDRKVDFGTYSDTLEVRHDQVGIVIGKGGLTIQKIERNCGVLVTKPKRDDPPIFVIRGTPENVEQAKKAILNVVSSFSHSAINKRVPVVITTANEVHFAKFHGEVASFDLNFKDIYVLEPIYSLDEEKKASELQLQSLSKSEEAISSFVKQLENLATTDAFRESSEHTTLKLIARFGKMLFSRIPEELLSENIPTSEFMNMIQNFKLSLQTQSDPNESNKVKEQIVADNPSVTKQETYEINAVDNITKQRLKVSFLARSMKIRRVLVNEVKLLVVDYMLLSRAHDIRLCLQSQQRIPADEDLIKFVSEIQPGKDTGELIIPAASKYIVECLRYKDRTRYTCKSKDYILDISNVVQTEFGVVRKKVEMKVKSESIKQSLKSPIDTRTLINQLPSFWDTVVGISSNLH